MAVPKLLCSQNAPISSTKFWLDRALARPSFSSTELYLGRVLTRPSFSSTEFYLVDQGLSRLTKFHLDISVKDEKNNNNNNKIDKGRYGPLPPKVGTM